MAFASSNTNTQIGAACTQYTGMEVTINVPSAGFVVISAMVVEIIDHTNGIRDNHWVKIGTTAGDCIADDWLGLITIDADLPNDLKWPTTSLQRVDSVVAGAYTYYVNGIMTTGASAGDEFYNGSIVAVFYPS